MTLFHASVSFISLLALHQDAVKKRRERDTWSQVEKEETSQQSFNQRNLL